MVSWWSSPNSKHAFNLGCASLVSTTAAAIIGLTLYWVSDSPLCLVYGLENVVDLLSDVVVMWRFYCPSDVHGDAADELLQKREKRASIAISAVLLMLGIHIVITAIHDLKKGRDRLEEDAGAVIVISLFSLIVFGILTIFKLHYSIVLESSSLQKDGICSLIGTILSLGLLIDAIIGRKYPSAWWFDPTVALGCGLAAFAIGAQAIVVARCYQKLPIFSYSWWFVSQGGGGTENGPDKGIFVIENGDDIPNGTEMASKEPSTTTPQPPPLV